MDPQELLRLVDTLRREKDIDAEVVFQGVEAALLSAARKHFGASDDVMVYIDRETGQITAYDNDVEIDPMHLGRIAAQTAKQVMIQKIREAECSAIEEDYAERIGSIVTGTVQRFEGPNIVVNLGRTEGFLPRSEQIPSETYHVGERMRALIIEVRSLGTKVKVVLSRARAEFVQRLFEIEVPEVGDGVIRIMGIAREAGHRTKVAVNSLDSKVDSVGACVGVQGSRIRSIVDELNGEKIDIVRWSELTDVFIANTLKPAEIDEIVLDAPRNRAAVIVPDDQLSLAIGKKGQNVRLASKLAGWDIDIKTRPEHEAEAAGEAPPERHPGEAPAAPQEPAAAEPEHAPEPPEPVPEHAPESLEPTPVHTPEPLEPTPVHAPEPPEPAPEHAPELPEPTPEQSGADPALAAEEEADAQTAAPETNEIENDTAPGPEKEE